MTLSRIEKMECSVTNTAWGCMSLLMEVYPTRSLQEWPQRRRHASTEGERMGERMNRRTAVIRHYTMHRGQISVASLRRPSMSHP